MCEDAEDPYFIPIGCGEAGVDVEGYLTVFGMFFARGYRHAVDFRPSGILILVGPVVFIEFRTAEECQYRHCHHIYHEPRFGHPVIGITAASAELIHFYLADVVGF